MASDEEEIIYSDEESHLLNSNGEDDGMAWEIDWDNMVCVDEYGDDGDNPTAKVSSDSSSDDEFNDIELDAVDELDSVSDVTKQWKEKEIREGSDDDKKESEKEEGDPWSRWVGMKNEEEDKKMEKRRGEEKKEGLNVKREERRRDEKKRKELKRDDNRRDERKLTLAEKVVMGKMREDDAKRDTMNRFDRRSSPILSRISRIDDRKMKMNSSRDRRSLPIHSMMIEKRSESKERRDISPSHDRRKERSPRRIPSSLMKKEDEERRRHSSPLRKERRISPSRREKRNHEKKEDRRRMERSPERRGENHRGHSPNRESIRRNRPYIPHKGDSIPSISSNHRLSSSNRCITRRSRSPMGRKREENPNLVKIGETRIVRKEISPQREERPPSPKIIPRKELPSLLDVKTPHSRMDGRVKRMENDEDEEKPKEIIVKDGRDEKNGKKIMEMKTKMTTTSKGETIEEEKKEERKRHAPIVWNEKETDAKKMHRSIGHMEGIETIERRRKEDEMKEEILERKMRLEKVGDAVIPASMASRVAKFSVDEKDKVTPVVIPPLCDVELKKSVDPPPSRLDPSNVVRTIVNTGAVTRQPVKAIEKKSVVMEKEEEEEEARVETGEYEDEGGWLSTKLQNGGNVVPKECSTRVDKMNPSSAALRLLCRATASAASSSTMKDSRPILKKEVHSPINGPDLFGENKGGKNKKNMVEGRLKGRIKKRSLDDFGKKKRKNNPSNEVSAGIPRLLESYF